MKITEDDNPSKNLVKTPKKFSLQSEKELYYIFWGELRWSFKFELSCFGRNNP